MPNFPRILFFLGNAFRRLKWKQDDLIKYQEKRLRSVIRNAYDFVPFYHAKFREAGIVPEDINGLSDLEKLPLIRKDEIRQRSSSSLISNQYNVKNLKVLRTSGSTGKPFKFFINHIEDAWRKSIYLRANLSCGQRPADTWYVVTAPRHFYDTTKIQRILGIFSQNCISVFAPVSKQIRLMKGKRIDILDGYSGALFLLAKEIEREDIKDINPGIMFGSADLIDPPARRYMERILKAPFYDQYGCAEVDRTAWQCPEKVGYHMDVDSVITQFVDDEGKDVSPGERGEIVFTSLFNYAMPFIRYSVGDVGIPSAEVCSCGRGLPLMEIAEGRKDSFLTLPGGRTISPRTLTVGMSMFEHYDDIEQFRIIQKKQDHFEFMIRVNNEKIHIDNFNEKLKNHFNKIFNISSQNIIMDVHFVDEIPLGKTGRLMAVISEL